MLGWSPTGSGERGRKARPARCFTGNSFSDTRGYYPKSVKSRRRTTYLTVKRGHMKTIMVGPPPPFLMITASLQEKMKTTEREPVPAKTTVNNMMCFLPMLSPTGIKFELPYRVSCLLTLFYKHSSTSLKIGLFQVVCGSPMTTLTAVCYSDFKSLCVTEGSK